MNFTREGKYYHQWDRADGQRAAVVAVALRIVLLPKLLSERAVVNWEVRYLCHFATATDFMCIIIIIIILTAALIHS